MKRLRNHLIGVDQGTSILFSDFEDNGPMWAGNGPREKRKRINFSTPFKSIPNVMVTMDMFDMDQKTNQRADVSAMAIDHNGFDAVFKTWGDTKIARVRVAWMAIGEVKGEDEWDLY